jgi:hypothetical protein
MEAPEKIWMNDDWFHQFDDKDFMGEDSVEYIRTDVFMKKAIKYITNHFLAPGMDNEINDFVNYIKGE